MAGHKSILDAVKAADVHIVNTTRAEARTIGGVVTEMGEDIASLSEAFLAAIDAAQADADEEGKATYVVLKINGGAI